MELFLGQLSAEAKARVSHASYCLPNREARALAERPLATLVGANDVATQVHSGMSVRGGVPPKGDHHGMMVRDLAERER